MAIKLCQTCDSFTQICDFCKHYHFNGEYRNGKYRYVDKGCCDLFFLPSDPVDGCEFFYCFKAEE